jgi:hypothetical protein
MRSISSDLVIKGLSLYVTLNQASKLYIIQPD